MKAALRFLFPPLLFLTLAACSDEAKNPKEAAQFYKAEFTTLPPATVTNIQGKQLVIRDAMRGWLCFNTDKATFDGLVKEKGFVPDKWADFKDATGGANIPKWWTPPEGMTAVYKKESWRKDLQTSNAHMAYDESTGTVYFCHSGTD